MTTLKSTVCFILLFWRKKSGPYFDSHCISQCLPSQHSKHAYTKEVNNFFSNSFHFSKICFSFHLYKCFFFHQCLHANTNQITTDRAICFRNLINKNSFIEDCTDLPWLNIAQSSNAYLLLVGSLQSEECSN